MFFLTSDTGLIIAIVGQIMSRGKSYLYLANDNGDTIQIFCVKGEVTLPDGRKFICINTTANDVSACKEVWSIAKLRALRQNAQEDRRISMLLEESSIDM
jgi:hypothetical protein